MDWDDDQLLIVEGLTKHFPIHGSDKYVQACEDVSLELRRGETLGVVGESGSGKTTLGRCILRLLPPTSGSIIFQGRDLATLDSRELREVRSDMQIVFQEPFDSMNPMSTIGRQIERPLRLHTSMGRTQRQERVRELLGLVGLPAWMRDAFPRGIPPGALQRCAIARALASEPQLIVLDEPTSALPPEAEADIVDLLRTLQEQFRLAYIFISHDLSLVRRVSHRVAVMYLGQIVELSTAEALFARPRHPYSQALLASALFPDPKSPRAWSQSLRLSGEIPSPIDLPLGCYLASRCPFALDQCRSERQRLRELSATHQVRCWRAAEGELEDDSSSVPLSAGARRFPSRLGNGVHES